MLRLFPMLLLIVAAIGLLSCTVFLGMVMVAVRRYRRTYPSSSAPDRHPLASLLKPLCGLEPGLEENLESFFVQDDTSYELIFVVRDASESCPDGACTSAARHPEVAVQFVLSGCSRPWPSGEGVVA